MDVSAGLAEAAREQGLTRPVVTEGTEFVVEDGFHPVVHKANPESPFVRNDCDLSEKVIRDGEHVSAPVPVSTNSHTW